ncbi:cupin domain-containing protein [Gammaproteobacteria bacterium]|nr:cupin domain-containing protein [Gammaproteobacteria bacterium]
MKYVSVNLESKLKEFSEHWSPRTVSEFNGHDIMVAKLEGEYHWHSHPDTDDFFLVLSGEVTIKIRDKDDVVLRAGELFVVPAGVEHQPICSEEAHILLIEKSGTPNSGDVDTAAPRQFL